ncbi:protein kinase [Corallococcus exiguus]|nr:protein kinase [Corallococcus exiguus]NPC47560.1 protein kinase [Corallococcus exiguus]NRD67229.1 protein kinase [Corallococcus exiguus]RKH80826.1 protein kinase family protein [Corallococcus sp. AB032C]
MGQAVGQGHFGSVYECIDDWGNHLAAKIITPKKESYEEVKRRWMHEAKNLILMRHPNITYVYDVFEYNDTFYIIMERCALTLKNLMDGANFNGHLWILPIARCILQGVDFIHDQGYAHKDLHYQNIFISFIPDEVVKSSQPATVFKVGDLGISRLEDEIDQVNTVLADWMRPPEALDPLQFGTISRLVDIYHAGLLFLTILQGRVLSFTREEVLAGAPRIMAESLASPYGPAIAKALRRHTQKRTQTALEFWRDLNNIAQVTRSDPLAHSAFSQSSRK